MRLKGDAAVGALFLTVGLALASLMTALILSGCSDPMRTARREVDRLSRSLTAADADLRRVTHELTLRVAIEEGTARGRAMRQAGCPSAALEQPASAPAACAQLARDARAKYERRVSDITAAATRVDKAISAAWASLLVVVSVLQDIDGGWGSAKTLQQRLQVVLKDALATGFDAYTAYQTFRNLLEAK